MQIRINVVVHEKEQLFEVDGILFDCLIAYEGFEGGQLSIIRNEEVIDKTSSIRVVGTQIEWTCFCGMKLKGDYPEAVVPSDFQMGDILSLDSPSDFDFVNFLRRQALFLSATLQAKKFANDKIIRFRSTSNAPVV